MTLPKEGLIGGGQLFGNWWPIISPDWKNGPSFGPDAHAFRWKVLCDATCVFVNVSLLDCARSSHFPKHVLTLFVLIIGHPYANEGSCDGGALLKPKP